jgi:hypothetical protein
MGLAKRSWPEIVVHIPTNLGSRETSSTEPSSGRLGFKSRHIWFDWLKKSAVLWLGCFSGLTLFGQSCRMDRPKIAHQNKARQILESKSLW